jgi:CPA2 family monovalent cation:H+ antiporter-2
MSEIPGLMMDLALVLTLAGVVTLVFKKLKQPLVLGYIMAGCLASPHMPYTPSVTDMANIHTWADIGVIFLLFSLGLEFSVKKIIRMGLSPVIAACTILFFMMSIGVFLAHAFAWSEMDALFLGGMLAMSSTTIIYKAFDDLGLRHQRFAGKVLGVLILEDILAIVLMVMLSTLAAGQSIGGGMILQILLRLAFVLVVWFVVGIYVIPQFLKKSARVMSDETLLIVSLGLCFAMVVVAASMGFSAAFGAFVMGAILAETLEAERIAHLVEPVKNLFGAIFFVSVGMLVDWQVLVDYAGPIAVLTCAVILGQMIFGTLGFMFSGEPLRVAMQCGFSMGQIGEFAFIIASLGVSLGVTDSFLYPIVVAVSVITTFLTPYMMRASKVCYGWVERVVPRRVIHRVDGFTSFTVPMHHDESNWRLLLVAMLRQFAVFSMVSVAIIILMFNFVHPFLKELIPVSWANIVTQVLTLVCISPFLRAIVMKKAHSEEIKALWVNRINRVPIILLLTIRAVCVVMIVCYVVGAFNDWASSLVIGVALVILLAMIASKQLKQRSIAIEKTFKRNLRSRETREEFLAKAQPAYASSLLTRDIHLSDFEVPAASKWVGSRLYELALGEKYGVHIYSILRGNRRFNIPDADMVIYPGDKLQVIGSDNQLSMLQEVLTNEVYPLNDDMYRHEMELTQIYIDEQSPFYGKLVRESGMKEQYHCMIVGFENGQETLDAPTGDRKFEEGDVVWIVGEKSDVAKLEGVE